MYRVVFLSYLNFIFHSPLNIRHCLTYSVETLMLKKIQESVKCRIPIPTAAFYPVRVKGMMVHSDGAAF
jgi:hypothetical protein